MASVNELVSRINEFVINPLIGLLFVLALLYFFYGLAQFVLHAGEDEGRDTGKQHMLWGIIGMFIMLSVFEILGVLANTFGVDLPN